MLNDKSSKKAQYIDQLEKDLQSEEDNKQILNKSFGHISHCKMLRDGTVFLVRSLNKCEIRRLDDTFSLVTDFTHIGEEVYAVDIVYDDEIQASHLGPGGECIQIQVAGRVEEIKVKPGEKNEVIDSAENNNEYSNNFNQEGAQNQMNLTEEKKDDIKYTIVLLDIDGGVNTYRDGNIQQEFNLYDIENIEQDQKDKQFFSLGYAYYIKYDGNYFCISSDHGCYVITNTDNK